MAVRGSSRGWPGRGARWLVLGAVALLLGGCWDRLEIEDTAYVVAAGIDAARGEYLWTFRVVEAEPIPTGMLTPPPAQPAPERLRLVTVRGASLEQALQLLQASLARVATLEHLRTVVVSQEVARQGLGPLLNQFLRHNQVRRTVAVLVARDQAADLMVQNEPGEVNPVRAQEGLILSLKRMHLGPPVRLQHFFARLLAPGVDPILPLVAVSPLAAGGEAETLPPMGTRSVAAGEGPRAGGNPLEAAGTAVFRGDRLAGVLTVDETAALLALRGEMGKVYASFPDPREEGTIITLRLHQENKPRYRVDLQGGRPVAAIHLQLEGEILSSPGRTDYSAPENRRLLERHVARYLVENVYTPLIRRMYNEWGADPIGIGQLLRGRFATFDDWLAFRWPDRVWDLRAQVSIELFIRRFGLLLDNPRTE